MTAESRSSERRLGRKEAETGGSIEGDGAARLVVNIKEGMS
jgi:hypothetical protein